MSEQLGWCRYVYNRTLAARRDLWEQQQSVGYYETIQWLPGWKVEQPALKQVHSQVLQDVHLRIDLAFKAFFRRVKAGEDPGYPRFKIEGRYDSMTYPQYRNGVVLVEGRLRLSKIGDIKIKLHRPIEGKVKTVVITRNRLGKWYACFSCEVESKPLLKTGKVVGIDLGLTTFATLSNETAIDNPRFFRRDEQTLAKAQRRYNRYKHEAGKERSDEERRLARKYGKVVCHIHQRITNRRTNFAHQRSRELVNAYELIAFEKLQIQDMMQHGKAKSKAQQRGLNKSMGDAAWRQLLTYTLYKAVEAGKVCVEVDPRGTTQRCSRCGLVVPKDLSVRIHDCPHCGLKIDRDLNAALNILALGMQSVGYDP